jgi:predicted transcriptional regulator
MINMGGKIPRPIRVQVIRAWLEGKSRDKIAQELGISEGAVSSIINNSRKEDSEFDLLRAVVKKIKNQNMDVESFASLVRLNEVLREKGLLTGITRQRYLEVMQNRLEALIVSLEVLCFKGELPIEDFVGLMTNMYNTAEKLGISLDKFPTYITELKDKIDAERKELDQLEANKQEALKDFNMTLESLQEYNANKPFIIKIRKLEQQLADAEEKISKGQEELKNERFWNEFEEQYTWRVSVEEINNASLGLGLSTIGNFDRNPSLSVSDLKKWVKDVFYHPSKYVGVIRQMRDIYNSQCNSITTSIN